jgi:hypothetical protein
LALWMTFLLGRQAMLGHEPPISPRSITAVRRPARQIPGDELARRPTTQDDVLEVLGGAHCGSPCEKASDGLVIANCLLLDYSKDGGRRSLQSFVTSRRAPGRVKLSKKLVDRRATLHRNLPSFTGLHSLAERAEV